jgi:hypothetical protein
MARFDFDAVREELQTYRSSGERASERVAYLGSRIIKDGYYNKLQDDSKSIIMRSRWCLQSTDYTRFQSMAIL